MAVINETYRDYLVNTPDVRETIEDISLTLGKRAEILLEVSQAGETRAVRYMPKSVKISDDDTFISRGVILPQETEASLRSENNDEVLVMIADLSSTTDDHDTAPAA